jgi:hypothetical protein
MSLSKTVVDTKDMATIVGQVDLAPGGEHKDRLRKGKIEPVAVGSCRSHHLQYAQECRQYERPFEFNFLLAATESETYHEKPACCQGRSH